MTKAVLIILLFISSAVHAQYACYKVHNAKSALVFDYINDESKLTGEYFFNSSGNILLSISFGVNGISDGYTVYSYDSSYCMSITTYNEKGEVKYFRKADTTNGIVPILIVDDVCNCNKKNSNVKCVFDKHENVVEISVYGEHSGLLISKRKLQYSYK